MKTLLLSISIFVFLALLPAEANQKSPGIPEETAIRCIAGEARGESLKGQIAVAEVLRRRGSVSGIVGCRAKYQDSREIREKARKAWRRSKHTNFSRGADHFDGAAFPRPKWSKKMKKVAVVGNQIFWKA